MAHTTALEAESETVGDFNGYWQEPRREQPVNGSIASPPLTMRVIYSTVQYDVVYKSGVGGHATQADKVIKIPKTTKPPSK